MFWRVPTAQLQLICGVNADTIAKAFSRNPEDLISSALPVSVPLHALECWGLQEGERLEWSETSLLLEERKLKGSSGISRC